MRKVVRTPLADHTHGKLVQPTGLGTHTNGNLVKVKVRHYRRSSVRQGGAWDQPPF